VSQAIGNNITEAFGTRFFSRFIKKLITHLAGLDSQEAAQMLVTQDYSQLGFNTRLIILRTLTDLALASDTLREHVMARLEAYTTPKGRNDRGGGERLERLSSGGQGETGKASEDGGGDGEDEHSSAVSQVVMNLVADWLEWLDSQRWVCGALPADVVVVAVLCLLICLHSLVDAAGCRMRAELGTVCVQLNGRIAWLQRRPQGADSLECSCLAFADVMFQVLLAAS
jgi:hypothetical protein